MAAKPRNDIDGRSERALELAYRYLNRRERTVNEVRGHLARHDADDAAVEGAIRTLLDQRYLNDERFVRLFIEDKRQLGGWGNERITRALGDRGIAADLIADAFARDDAQDEVARAIELLRRRFPSPARTRRERDRALRVLIRKGYDSELAIDALAAHTRAATEEVQ